VVVPELRRKPTFSLETKRDSQSRGKVAAKNENGPGRAGVIWRNAGWGPESKPAVRVGPVRMTTEPFAEYSAVIVDGGERLKKTEVSGEISRRQIVSPALTKSRPKLTGSGRTRVWTQAESESEASTGSILEEL
jgi:hypothetical protein